MKKERMTDKRSTTDNCGHTLNEETILQTERPPNNNSNRTQTTHRKHTFSFATTDHSFHFRRETTLVKDDLLMVCTELGMTPAHHILTQQLKRVHCECVFRKGLEAEASGITKHGPSESTIHENSGKQETEGKVGVASVSSLR
jgi:hypothetical protein